MNLPMNLPQIINQEKGVPLTTSTTSTTSTTIHIANWGFVDLDKGILLEQISKDYYLCNIDGIITLDRLHIECPKCSAIINNSAEKVKCTCGNVVSNEIRKLKLGKYIFVLDSKPKDPIYSTPTIEEISKYLPQIMRQISTKEVYDEIVLMLETLFEFSRPEDSKLIAVFILLRWQLIHFNSAFNLGFDATKNSGKTTIEEIVTHLSRHGIMADMSPAAIPRLKTKYDLSLAIDEIDQLSNPEDVMGMIRKGQRRGNKYVRLNKNTLEEEVFEAFGAYIFSFRTMLEDAFISRSVLIRPVRAKDARLSIINLDKEQILRPLFVKIFFWYTQNIFTFGSKSSKKYEVVRDLNGELPSSKALRNDFYAQSVKEFSKEEKNLISSLLGRNSEIVYNLLQACRFFNIDVLTEIETLIKEKQVDEEVPDDYYTECMRQIYLEDIKLNDTWKLKKGDFASYCYFPKTKFYIRLVEKLRDKNLMTIGTPKYNGLLKDMGFVKNVNIKNQKVENVAVPCLIFDREVLRKLNIDEENISIQTIRVVST